MRKGVTRRVAIGCIVTGTLIGGAETFGMTSLRAARKTEIATAEDPDALLGIEHVDDPASAPAFENRTAGSIAVVLETDADGVSFNGDTGNEASLDLAPNERREIEIRSTDRSEVDVTVTAASLEDGADVGTIELQRTFAVPKTDRLEIGSVQSRGQSGKLEFEITNIGTEPVTLVGIGVNETTNTDALEVAHGDMLTVDGAGSVVSEPIPIDSERPAEDTRREFERDVEVPAEGTIEFQFDRFRRDGPPPNADMEDEDVRITLYIEDGASETHWLRNT